ncbi:MAG: D-alanine-D-alanine ligase-like ATP-grasp enzyme [Saprospiraceae bacterium]|jgi:D-alanine-D-alanine ligase-like ATP-grasp enzyme
MSSLLQKPKTAIYAWISKTFMDGCSNYNSLAVRKACRSKGQGRAIFEKNDIPHARGTIFLWPWTAHRFAKQHGFPLVIKPNVSGYSRGSYFPINNYKQLYKAMLFAKIWWPTTVIEQFLLGSNYRVLGTDHSLISVIRRYSPFVDGNGVDMISVLIDKENEIREQMQLHPVIFKLNKDEQVTGYLAKQNLSLNSVPADNERIELFHRVALSPGGVVETIDRSTIPKVNKALFNKVVKVFDANVFGIDVIFEKGIEIPFNEQKCIFIEVNSRPYIKMHHYPRYGEKEDLSDALAELDELDVVDQDTF